MQEWRILGMQNFREVFSIQRCPYRERFRIIVFVLTLCVFYKYKMEGELTDD